MRAPPSPTYMPAIYCIAYNTLHKIVFWLGSCSRPSLADQGSPSGPRAEKRLSISCVIAHVPALKVTLESHTGNRGFHHDTAQIMNNPGHSAPDLASLPARTFRQTPKQMLHEVAGSQPSRPAACGGRTDAHATAAIPAG